MNAGSGGAETIGDIATGIAETATGTWGAAEPPRRRKGRVTGDENHLCSVRGCNGNCDTPFCNEWRCSNDHLWLFWNVYTLGLYEEGWKQWVNA